MARRLICPIEERIVCDHVSVGVEMGPDGATGARTLSLAEASGLTESGLSELASVGGVMALDFLGEKLTPPDVRGAGASDAPDHLRIAEAAEADSGRRFVVEITGSYAEVREA
jgi:hypothetical protein